MLDAKKGIYASIRTTTTCPVSSEFSYFACRKKKKNKILQGLTNEKAQFLVKWIECTRGSGLHHENMPF